MANPGLETLRSNANKEGILEQPSSIVYPDLMSSARQKLEDASRQQTEVAQEREALLIQRQQLRMDAKSVSEQRMKTGTAEVAFMASLRQFYVEHNLEFPFSLKSSYEQVEKERDTLGVLEDDYMQAERTFGGAEWLFIEKENFFFRHILVDAFKDKSLAILRSTKKSKPAPSQPSVQYPCVPFRDVVQAYRTATSELEQLKKRFNALRDQQAAYIEEKKPTEPIFQSEFDTQDYQSFMDQYSDLLTRIVQAEVRVQQIKQDALQYDDYTKVIDRRASDSPVFMKTDKVPSDDHRSVHTDGALPKLLENFPDARSRIKGWIWDYLSNNAMEQTQFKNLLEYFGASESEDESWQDLASRYWDNDMSDRAPDKVVQESQRPSRTHLTSGWFGGGPGEDIGRRSTDTAYNTTRIASFGLTFDESFNYAPIHSHVDSDFEDEHGMDEESISSAMMVPFYDDNTWNGNEQHRSTSALQNESTTMMPMMPGHEIVQVPTSCLASRAASDAGEFNIRVEPQRMAQPQLESFPAPKTNVSQPVEQPKLVSEAVKGSARVLRTRNAEVEPRSPMNTPQLQTQRPIPTLKLRRPEQYDLATWDFSPTVDNFEGQNNHQKGPQILDFDWSKNVDTQGCSPFEPNDRVQGKRLSLEPIGLNSNILEEKFGSWMRPFAQGVCSSISNFDQCSCCSGGHHQDHWKRKSRSKSVPNIPNTNRLQNHEPLSAEETLPSLFLRSLGLSSNTEDNK